MRDRFVAEGIKDFAEHEVLEMLLFMCIPYKDTNKIAHNLINSLGSLSAVMDAPIDTLARIAGISTTSATNIKILRQSWERYKVSRANSTDVKSLKDIVDHASTILDNSRHESIIAYYVDGNTCCVGYELFDGASHNSIFVNNKDIVASAMGYGATGVVLVHNHPVSNCTPSVADIKYTEGIYNTLKGIDVTLLDHTVLGSNGDTYSMAVHGIMAKIREKYNL